MSQRSTSYPRFGIWPRLEHGLLILSFTILAISGLPQKYPDSGWGDAMIQMMGGIEATRQIHHIAAIVLMLETIYHGAVVTYKVWVKRVRLTILPGWQDVKDGFQALAYNVGLAKTPPRMDRYTFGEKIEYWAVVWGTVIMIITGFMLWNPIATTNFLPGQFVPAAKAAHGGEAVLAVLSIITWHVYNVHLKHFNKSIFTGRISRHEMVEEHPLELADLEAGRISPPPEDGLLQRRHRIFIPVAIAVAVILLTGLYLFVTFEQTAITTVPRQVIEVYVPAAATPQPIQ
jgi:cytochrome b subunit of formate dehydrogenase